MAAAGAGGMLPVEGRDGNISPEKVHARRLQRKSLSIAKTLKEQRQSEESLNRKLHEMITNGSFEPQKLFDFFLPNINILPLVRPHINLDESLSYNGREIKPEIAKKIIKKTHEIISSKPVLESNATSEKTNKEFTEEEAFKEMEVDENNNSTTNVVTFTSSTRDYLGVDVLEPKHPGPLLYIDKTIEDAVLAVFSPAASADYKSNIQNYPIYFIGALPNQDRHLTLLVFFNGILYSCGISIAREQMSETEAFSQATAAGLSLAAPFSGVAASTGVGASGIGSTGGIGASIGYKQKNAIARGPSISQNALLLSPDFLYRGTEKSRIFHMGILTPEHLERLKAQFPIKNRQYKLNFKNFENTKQQFIGFKFVLDDTFALGAFPGTGYMNCTVFILNIFGNKIKCYNDVLGRLLPDPKQCIIRSLQDIASSTELFPETNIFYKNLNTIINFIRKNATRELFQLFSVSKTNYYARDAYIVFLLARFLRDYMLSIPDPTLINLLIDWRSAAPAAAGGAAAPAPAAAAAGAGAAHMTNEGGRRRLRRKRQTRKRKSKAYRQPLKRRATKRQ